MIPLPIRTASTLVNTVAQTVTKEALFDSTPAWQSTILRARMKSLPKYEE